MDNIMRVQDLIRELEALPPHCPVMINVVKYPQEFTIDANWDTSSYVEACPLEVDETIAEREGIVYLCIELTDFSEERREYLGEK